MIRIPTVTANDRVNDDLTKPADAAHPEGSVADNGYDY